MSRGPRLFVRAAAALRGQKKKARRGKIAQISDSTAPLRMQRQSSNSTSESTDKDKKKQKLSSFLADLLRVGCVRVCRLRRCLRMSSPPSGL